MAGLRTLQAISAAALAKLFKNPPSHDYLHSLDPWHWKNEAMGPSRFHTSIQRTDKNKARIERNVERASASVDDFDISPTGKYTYSISHDLVGANSLRSVTTASHQSFSNINGPAVPSLCRRMKSALTTAPTSRYSLGCGSECWKKRSQATLAKCWGRHSQCR